MRTWSNKIAGAIRFWHRGFRFAVAATVTNR